MALLSEPSARSAWLAICMAGCAATASAANAPQALRDAADWGDARWIGMDPAHRDHAAPPLRKTFAVTQPVVQGLLYVCGLGYHEAWLNGRRLGAAVLEPGQTDYDRRCFYVAHDVTHELIDGPNALGVWLGDGFFNQDQVWGPKGLSYGQPRLCARLEIAHADGTRTVVVSDSTWTCAKSAVVASNIYRGESYDARLESDAWARADFPDASWQPAAPMEPPGGVLVAEELPPA